MFPRHPYDYHHLSVKKLTNPIFYPNPKLNFYHSQMSLSSYMKRLRRKHPGGKVWIPVPIPRTCCSRVVIRVTACWSTPSFVCGLSWRMCNATILSSSLNASLMSRTRILSTVARPTKTANQKRAPTHAYSLAMYTAIIFPILHPYSQNLSSHIIRHKPYILSCKAIHAAITVSSHTAQAFNTNESD